MAVISTPAKIKAVEAALNEAGKLPDGRIRPFIPVGVLRSIIGGALNDLHVAYGWSGVGASQRKSLDDARIPLERWLEQLSVYTNGQVPFSDYSAKRPFISRAYVNIYGVEGEVDAQASNSLGDAIVKAVQTLPQTLGEAVKVGATAVKEVVGYAADVAGQVTGGLLAGLWPVLLVVAVIAIGVFYLNKKVG